MRGVAMFIWMMFVLKIPIAMLLILVWWAIKDSDQTEVEWVDSGGGRPHAHPRPRRPRPPRRGPHAEPPPRSPSRVRARGRRLEPAHSLPSPCGSFRAGTVLALRIFYVLGGLLAVW